MRNWYRIEAKAQQDVADVYVFAEIGKSYWDDETVTASKFVTDLNALPDAVKTIRVHVNSPGGSVFEAHAIANALRAQRSVKGRAVEMTIDGIAASAATIITSAGSPIRIADNAMMMIHDPIAIEMGPASALRKMADALDGIKNSIIAAYRWVSQKTADELATMMTDTTWMDAAQAIENGLATEIVQGAQVTNCFRPDALARLGVVPDPFRARVEAMAQTPETPPLAQQPAAAADILRLCADADLDLAFAGALVASSATPDQAQARIADEQGIRREATARAETITAICDKAKLPELAQGYIEGAMSVDAVSAHLTVLTAKLDSVEIDGSLAPDRGTTTKARIDVSAVYAERNRMKEKTS